MESLSGCHYVVRCEQIDFQGPYIYHVSTFCTFSEASIHYFSISIVLNVSKNGCCLNPPTQSYADVIYEWSMD